MAEAIRLGVIVPSVNIVVEEWYPRIVPGGVSVHFARMLIADGSSPEKIIAMDREDGMRAIRQIASCRPQAVAYGCTASSIVQGHAFDEHLRGEIRHIAGAPATTATDSIFAACLNFRSHPIIDALERRIGKPVVTSTQAVLWHLLRLAGVNTPIHGFGRLLQEH